MVGSCSAGGEDIWEAVLEQEVRMSGPGEDIWLAVLQPDVRISGPGKDSGSFRAKGEDIWAR